MIDKKKDFKRISHHYINLIKINHEEIIRKIPVKKYHIRYYWFLSDTIFQIYYSISISFFHRLIRSIKFLDSIYQQSHNPPSFSKKSPRVFPFLYHPKEINFDLQTFQKKKETHPHIFISHSVEKKDPLETFIQRVVKKW